MRFVGCLLGSACCLFGVSVAHGCAAVPPTGMQVEIIREEAVIVWDAARKLQHFIRRATFATRAASFGFLVPTPTMPVLAAASDEIFRRLARVILPKVIYKETRLVVPVAFCLSPFNIGSKSTPGAVMRTAAVQVLHTQRVAGFEAAVLEASSAEALADWLRKHDYPSSSALQKWLEPYVSRKWKITAFKVARREPGSDSLGTSSVRMSFETDRPFFPYREPQQTQSHVSSPDRTLRIFLVAGQKMRGTIGHSGSLPGTFRYANKLETVRSLLAGGLPAEDLPESAWVHEYVDRSAPRQGLDELYFSVASDQQPLLPAPIIRHLVHRVPVPLDLIGILIAGLLGGFMLLRRRRLREPVEGV